MAKKFSELVFYPNAKKGKPEESGGTLDMKNGMPSTVREDKNSDQMEITHRSGRKEKVKVHMTGSDYHIVKNKDGAQYTVDKKGNVLHGHGNANEEFELAEGYNKKSKAHALAAKLTSNSTTSKAEYHSDGSASIHHRSSPTVSSASQADNAIKNAGGEHNNSEAALKNHKQTIDDLKIHVKKTDSGHTTHISESVEPHTEERGLWANIHAKRKRIEAGSGERMRKPGSEGAPTKAALKASQNEETAGNSYEAAQKHKDLADEHAEEHGKESSHYHHAMANHHEAMGRWHESKGRTSSADKEFNKADSHHEQGVAAATRKNEEVELDEKLTVGGGAPVKGPHGVVSNTPPKKVAINKTTGQEYPSSNKEKPEPTKPATPAKPQSSLDQLRARMAAARRPVKEAADVLEGRSDSLIQTTAANADENAKHIFKLRDDHGIYAQQGAGASHHILVPREHEDKARKVLAGHLKEETVDEGMARQDRERASNEADRRAAAIANNPRIAAEVERRKKAAEAAKKKPTYALGSYSVKEEAELEEATPTSMQVKQGIGIARDKRYAGGNMTGAVKAMDKVNKGLAQHPAVKKELQKQNEAKDQKEYGYEGDMALNQLSTLTRCADMIKDMLKPDTDLPEWVQSKITLATDYIQTAADYMYSELKEELAESASELNKHVSDFSKGVKSSAAKQSTYKRDGKPIHNMKHVETDSDHQKVFDHLKKMGYKKTGGYDSKPNEFTMHHNREEMTAKSDPVHHSSGVSAHVEKEHGGKTKVHFTHRNIKEQAPVAPSLMKHRISVTVSDPDHTMVSKRKEKVQKTVIVTHSDNKEGAQKVGEKFYKKKGFVVHDSHHAGMVKEEVELDEKMNLATAKMGDVIKDFQKSDAPQFAGKSAEKKRQMAIAAKLQADGETKKEETMLNFASFVEALKGGQRKLDKNKNGKVDSHDFKLLRKEETELEEGSTEDNIAYRKKQSDDLQARKAAMSKSEKDSRDAYHANKDKHQGHDISGNASKAQSSGAKGHGSSIMQKGANAVKKFFNKEELELQESRVNGREYASQGVMHPDHAKMDIHKPSNQDVDFYASKTGDKMQGKVLKNDGKEVHIKAHKELGDGKLHKFKVTANLPKPQNEEVEIEENAFDYKSKRTDASSGRYEIKRVDGRTIVTRKYNPDTGISTGTDDNEPAEKRGRGRPAGSKNRGSAK